MNSLARAFVCSLSVRARHQLGIEAATDSLTRLRKDLERFSSVSRIQPNLLRLCGMTSGLREWASGRSKCLAIGDS